MKKNIKKAFTLVEMLIVIIIIGILMASLLPKITGAQAGARDAGRKADLNNIKPALIKYNAAYGKYPSNHTCANELSGDLKTWLDSIPRDPQSNRLAYGTKTDGCKGEYAYTSMKYSTAEDGGYVLIANTETYADNMNYVLSGSGDTPSVTFDTGSETLTVKKKQCDKVFLSGDDTISGCSETDHEGYLGELKNPFGVYVIFNN